MKVTFKVDTQLKNTVDWKYVQENAGVYIYSKDKDLDTPKAKFVSFGNISLPILYIERNDIQKAYDHWSKYTFYKIDEQVIFEF